MISTRPLPRPAAHALGLLALLIGLQVQAAAQIPSADVADEDFTAPFLQHPQGLGVGVHTHDLVHMADGRVVAAFVERSDPSLAQIGWSFPQDELVIVTRSAPGAPWVQAMRSNFAHDQILDVCLTAPPRRFGDGVRDRFYLAVTLENYRQGTDVTSRQRAVAVFSGTFHTGSLKGFHVAFPAASQVAVSWQAAPPRPRITTVPSNPDGSQYFVDVVFVDPANRNAGGGNIHFARSSDFGGSFSQPVRLTGPEGSGRARYTSDHDVNQRLDVANLANQRFRHPSIWGSWDNRYTAIAFQNELGSAVEILRVGNDLARPTAFTYEDELRAPLNHRLLEPAIATANEGATLVVRGGPFSKNNVYGLLWFRGLRNPGYWVQNLVGTAGRMVNETYSAPDLVVHGNWMRVAVLGRLDGSGPTRAIAVEGVWRPSSSHGLGFSAVDDPHVTRCLGEVKVDFPPTVDAPHLGALYSFQRQRPVPVGTTPTERRLWLN